MKEQKPQNVESDKSKKTQDKQERLRTAKLFSEEYEQALQDISDGYHNDFIKDLIKVYFAHSKNWQAPKFADIKSIFEANKNLALTRQHCIRLVLAADNKSEASKKHIARQSKKKQKTAESGSEAKRAKPPKTAEQQKRYARYKETLPEIVLKINQIVVGAGDGFIKRLSEAFFLYSDHWEDSNFSERIISIYLAKQHVHYPTKQQCKQFVLEKNEPKPVSQEQLIFNLVSQEPLPLPSQGIKNPLVDTAMPQPMDLKIEPALPAPSLDLPKKESVTPDQKTKHQKNFASPVLVTPELPSRLPLRVIPRKNVKKCLFPAKRSQQADRFVFDSIYELSLEDHKNMNLDELKLYVKALTSAVSACVLRYGEIDSDSISKKRKKGEPPRKLSAEARWQWTAGSLSNKIERYKAKYFPIAATVDSKKSVSQLTCIQPDFFNEASWREIYNKNQLLAGANCNMCKQLEDQNFKDLKAMNIFIDRLSQELTSIQATYNHFLVNEEARKLVTELMAALTTGQTRWNVAQAFRTYLGGAKSEDDEKYINNIKKLSAFSDYFRFLESKPMSKPASAPTFSSVPTSTPKASGLVPGIFSSRPAAPIKHVIPKFQSGKRAPGERQASYSLPETQKKSLTVIREDLQQTASLQTVKKSLTQFNMAFGKAYGKGDCFFDACDQALKQAGIVIPGGGISIWA